MKNNVLAKTYNLFSYEGHCECRFVGKKTTLVRHYDDFESFINGVEEYNSKGYMCYILMNEMGEYPTNSAQNHNKAATDAAIKKRHWILIDIDVEKPTGTASTDEQHKGAIGLAERVAQDLSCYGFKSIVKADSGNGAHLLIPVDFGDNTEVALVKEFLATLALVYNNDCYKVDTCTCNASRITKLYGSISKKGDQESWRESKILYVPESMEKNGKELFAQWISDNVPAKRNGQLAQVSSQMEVVSKGSNPVEAFLLKHHIVYKTEVKDDAIYYRLKKCPWRELHSCDDEYSASAIYNQKSGKAGFKCFHNHCQSRTWKDFCNFYEPQHKESFLGEKSTVIGWDDVEPEILDDTQIIKTGYSMIDEQVYCMRGGITVLCGERGKGKSTFVYNLILNTVDQGYNVVLYSGEAMNNRVKRQLTELGGSDNEAFKKAMGNHFRMINWESQLWKDNLDVAIESLEDCDLLILDNMKNIDTSNLCDGEYKPDKIFMSQLQALAANKKMHILLVTHPRKKSTNSKDSKICNDDINGSGDVADKAANVWLIQGNHQNKTIELELSKYRITNVNQVGAIKPVYFYFDPQSKQWIESENDGIIPEKRLFSWNKTEETTKQKPGVCFLVISKRVTTRA